MHRLINADCKQFLEKSDEVWDTIFADPPDNISLGYDAYDDNLPDRVYKARLYRWLRLFVDHAKTIWVSYNVKWAFAIGHIVDMFLDRFDDLEAKSCVQVFTFGQHNQNDLGNNHRPLLRLRRKDAPLFPDAIRVPSWRQLNGDKRADPRGRVPGDVFDMQYPSTPACKIGDWLSAALNDPAVCEKMKADILTWFETSCGDVFDFPRVTGNSKQRCNWHPTQLHEDLVERCLKLSTPPGGSVLDPFGGTGTTLRVCRKLGYESTSIEIDKEYCRRICEEQEMNDS
jgi:DNA modification methylase